jgi:hypothetical protein
MNVAYKFKISPPASPPVDKASPLPEELIPSIPPAYWSIPPLGMIAFPGFACVSTQSPVTFAHPAGHAAIVTVRSVDGSPTEQQSAEVVEASRKQVQEILSNVIERHGAPNVSSDELALWEGIRLVKVRANVPSFAGPRYFLLYAAISPIGHLALITVEGPGAPSEMAIKLDPIVKAVRFAT